VKQPGQAPWDIKNSRPSQIQSDDGNRIRGNVWHNNSTNFGASLRISYLPCDPSADYLTGRDSLTVTALIRHERDRPMNEQKLALLQGGPLEGRGLEPSRIRETGDCLLTLGWREYTHKS
jgi:hypothetical protein